MPAVQTSYSERIAQAVEGQVGNETNWDADTKIVETAAGIGFGKAVSQGTSDKQIVVGGALADFVGITIRDITLPASQNDTFAEGDEVGVLTEGDIWVKPSVEVVAGDPVHYNATTGVFTNTGGSGPIKGARYMTSNGGANGLALVRLGGGLPPN
jgi:hypothetical protein